MFSKATSIIVQVAVLFDPKATDDEKNYIVNAIKGMSEKDDKDAKHTKAAQIPNLVTLKEAAKILSASEGTVRRWVKSGLIKSHNIGRKYLVSIEELTINDEQPKE